VSDGIGKTHTSMEFTLAQTASLRCGCTQEFCERRRREERKCIFFEPNILGKGCASRLFLFQVRNRRRLNFVMNVRNAHVYTLKCTKTNFAGTSSKNRAFRNTSRHNMHGLLARKTRARKYVFFVTDILKSFQN